MNSMFEELLWVNWGVQGLTLLSDWFWLLYLSVPGYALYVYGSGFIANLKQEREALAAEDEAKRAAAGKKGRRM